MGSKMIVMKDSMLNLAARSHNDITKNGDRTT